MLDRKNENNRFRACFYNKIDMNQNAQVREHLANHVPVSINGAPVNLSNWMKAVENNPDRARLVPHQITSTAELKERMAKILETTAKVKKRLQAAKENLNIV